MISDQLYFESNIPIAAVAHDFTHGVSYSKRCTVLSVLVLASQMRRHVMGISPLVTGCLASTVLSAR
jgi:hypothetical protein